MPHSEHDQTVFGDMEGLAAAVESRLKVDKKPKAKAEPISTASKDRASSQAAVLRQTAATMPLPRAVGTGGKKKKRRGGMKPAEPAAKVTRGFQPAVMSGEDESDYSTVSTPRIGPSQSIATSVTNSPVLTPSALTRAISYQRLEEGGPLSSREPSERGSPLALLGRNADDFSRLGRATERSDTLKELILPGTASRTSSVQRKPIYADALEGGLRTDSPHRSPRRKMTAGDFEVLKCLGQGGFGTVCLVKQNSTGRLFAQKQLKKATVTETERLIESAKRERKILETIKTHPFVVKMFYAFQDHHKLYLILEYAQGGELFRHLQIERTFSEEVSAFYMAEMILALEHLHKNLGVIYRDLKPENCLLDAEGHLLLTDFGLSKMSEEGDTEDKCNSILGTVDYMAPEVVCGKAYDEAVDWWSLGAVGYDLLTGAPPFSSTNYAKTKQKIVHGKVSMPYFLGPDAKDLLTRLLRKEPKKRLGGNMPQDMKIIKSHRFFRRIDWTLLERRELTAPIQPIVTDPEAAENFDDQFTGMALSPVDESFLLGKSMPKDEIFSGFSYVASNSILNDCPLDL